MYKHAALLHVYKIAESNVQPVRDGVVKLSKTMCMVNFTAQHDHTKLLKAMYNQSKIGCKIATGYVYPKQSFGYKIELHIMIIPFILRVLE